VAVSVGVGLIALILPPIISKKTHKESTESSPLGRQVCVQFKVNLLGVDTKRKVTIPTTHSNRIFTFS